MSMTEAGTTYHREMALTFIKRNSTILQGLALPWSFVRRPKTCRAHFGGAHPTRIDDWAESTYVPNCTFRLAHTAIHVPREWPRAHRGCDVVIVLCSSMRSATARTGNARQPNQFARMSWSRLSPSKFLWTEACGRKRAPFGAKTLPRAVGRSEQRFWLFGRSLTPPLVWGLDWSIAPWQLYQRATRHHLNGS